MLYAFFWVIPRLLNFIFRRFGTLSLFHLRRQVGKCRMNSFYTHLPAHENGTECSETSAYKIQTPGNHTKESIQKQLSCMRLYFTMYTRVNKNPSAWNFLSPKPEVTCGTVAIIIRVFYFPHICAFVPFLCPPFITINHTAYILTEDDNTFA